MGSIPRYTVFNHANVLAGEEIDGDTHHRILWAFWLIFFLLANIGMVISLSPGSWTLSKKVLASLENNYILTERM